MWWDGSARAPRGGWAARRAAEEGKAGRSEGRRCECVREGWGMWPPREDRAVWGGGEGGWRRWAEGVGVMCRELLNLAEWGGWGEGREGVAVEVRGGGREACLGCMYVTLPWGGVLGGWGSSPTNAGSRYTVKGSLRSTINGLLVDGPLEGVLLGGLEVLREGEAFGGLALVAGPLGGVLLRAPRWTPWGAALLVDVMVTEGWIGMLLVGLIWEGPVDAWGCVGGELCAFEWGGVRVGAAAVWECVCEGMWADVGVCKRVLAWVCDDMCVCVCVLTWVCDDMCV